MNPPSYKVPRLLWENLESVLLAQSKRYIAELAKRLDVPEKELLKKVLPTSDSLKIILLDSQIESNQCHAYIQQGTMTVHCKRPVTHPSEFCSHHDVHRMTILQGAPPLPIQKVKDMATLSSMWVHQTTLLNANGDMVGKINDGKIKIFTYE